ncbi:MAG: glycosyltransferase [Anaerolineae bacterium]
MEAADALAAEAGAAAVGAGAMMFSVIVPTRNRPEALARCLASLSRLDYAAGDWELIVVNDGGESWETAVSPDLLNSLPLQTITISHAGPAAARNAGARLAHGRYLAFTDDDCAVEPDWLARLTDGFTQTGAQALGGQRRNPFPEHGAAVGAQHLVDFLYAHMQTADGCPVLLVANNAAYETEVFRQIGGYDETFRLAAAEDWEIGYRLLAAGFRQAYSPAAQVTHFHRQTWRGHWKQQFRYGRGGALLHRRIAFLSLQLAERRPFYQALFLYLRAQRVSMPVIAGVLAGQLAYRVGKMGQSMPTGRDAPQTAVTSK